MKRNEFKASNPRGSWYEYSSVTGFSCSNTFDFRWVNVFNMALGDVKLRVSGKIIGDE